MNQFRSERKINKMNEFFENIMQVGFMTETVGDWTWDMVYAFAIKCYNLFLAFFYFNIIKFVVFEVQKIVRRLKKFSNGGF